MLLKDKSMESLISSIHLKKEIYNNLIFILKNYLSLKMFSFKRK